MIEVNSPYDSDHFTRTVIRQIVYNPTLNRAGYIYQLELVGDTNDNPETEMQVYYSMSGVYIGNKGHAMFLLKRMGIRDFEVRDGNIASIGYNPDEKKWFGWSHRAIYGFRRGSTCQMGDCHYRPRGAGDFMEENIKFWSDEHHINVRSVEEVFDGIRGARTSWEYADTMPNKKLRGTTNSVFTAYPETWGKGEWRAKNMKDAKQMAIDFAEGVS